VASLRFRIVSLLAVVVSALAFSGCDGGGAGGGSSNVTQPATPTSCKAPSSSGPLALVWSDEFNGAANTAIDSSKWLYDVGTGYPLGPPQWGTGEVETMTNSSANVYQDGSSHLVINPIHTGSTPTGGWTSGRIETQVPFSAPCGRVLAVEASIQQPDVSGGAAAGYWAAFWMIGAPFRGNYNNWPSIGEIDAMEGIDGESVTYPVFHCGIEPGGACNEPTGISAGLQPCAGCQTAFHIYRVELDTSTSPQQIRWYLDGANIFTVNATQFDANTWANATGHGFYVILDLAMGGGFPGNPTTQTASGVPMLVDYMHVYESSTTP
jgi:beta-glucanase (GH16 family)